MATQQRLHFRFIPVILCLALGPACGQVNAPIPPEDVGIEAKLRKQQKQMEEQEKSSDDEVPIEEESVELPPLRPIGTR
ncbi:MAG: hypothetical protein JSU59_07530 [Nitrospirota bacterium]|nr:MAG: hypothetical protein JSU59_07530 [Nitrospirota bacterium]